MYESLQPTLKQEVNQNIVKEETSFIKKKGKKEEFVIEGDNFDNDLEVEVDKKDQVAEPQTILN